MAESTSVLDRAREAIDRKAWDKAYRLLSEADDGPVSYTHLTLPTN